MRQKSTTLKLVEGAMLIAIATVLSYIRFFNLPFGGSISLEIIPLIIMGLRNGPKWGFLTGFVHGIIQMIIGFSNVLMCSTLLSQIGCIVLDYVFSFGVLGLAVIFAKPFHKRWRIGYIIGAVIVGLLRFVCTFLSGVLIWGSYAPEGQPVWLYSLIYNGSYMLPDIVIMAVVIAILVATAPKLFLTVNHGNRTKHNMP